MGRWIDTSRSSHSADYKRNRRTGARKHLWAAPAGKCLVPRLTPQCRSFFGRTLWPSDILPFGPELFVSSVSNPRGTRSVLGGALLSTAPFARPRRWTNYLARTEDRRQISLILAKATSWRLLLPRTRAVSDRVSESSETLSIGLLIASDHCRVPGTRFVAKSSNPCQPFGHSWYIEYSPP